MNLILIIAACFSFAYLAIALLFAKSAYDDAVPFKWGVDKVFQCLHEKIIARKALYKL